MKVFKASTHEPDKGTKKKSNSSKWQRTTKTWLLPMKSTQCSRYRKWANRPLQCGIMKAAIEEENATVIEGSLRCYASNPEKLHE